MTFREIFRFEVVYLLRRPTTWVYLVALALLSHLVASGMLVQEAQRGDLHVNAPIGLAAATVMVTLFGLLITAALAGDAATRDVASGMHPLVYTAPMSKAAYVGGRFLGVFTVNAALLLVVPVAMWGSIAAADLEPVLLGPGPPAAYAQAYALLALPNAFVGGAILFAAALLTRRALASYLGGAALFVLVITGEEGVAESLGAGRLGALVDPLGFTAISELWALWTPFEKNTRLIGLSEMLLPNRLLWFALGAGALVLAHRLFRFEHFGARGRRRRTGPDAGITEAVASGPLGLAAGRPEAAPVRPPPIAAHARGPRTQLRQALEVARSAFRDIVVTRTFLGVATVLVVLVFTTVGASLHDYLATPMWPVSSLLAQVLGNSLIQLGVSVIVAVYAGELVWKERDARLNEIADAAPYPDWALFTGKALALVGMAAVLQLVLLVGALAVQLTGGVYEVDVGLYLHVLFGIQLIDYLLLIALALFVHHLLDHKQLGHMVVLLFYAFTVFAGTLGVTNTMLVYGRDPGWIYSAISGFGPFLEPIFWFKLYWAGWAALFALTASLFQVRGRETALRQRARLAGERTGPRVAGLAALAALLIVTTGGFVFYNTHVLNENLDPEARQARQAEYERRWGGYADARQPTVTGTSLQIEIWPEERSVDVRGTYRLENATDAAIDTVLVFVSPEVVLEEADLGPAARPVRAEPLFGSYLYALAQPLAPGDSLTLDFHVRFEPHGFPNAGINTSVVRNGTYFDHTGGRGPNHRRWLPVLGYQPSLELSEERDRAEHGLGPASPIPAPTDSAALRDPRGRETIEFEAVIGTSAEQIAVAPGTLRREWAEGGRRYFHYATERPVRNSFAIFSAAYDVYEAEWEGVRIEIFHHPEHAYNLERMTRSVRASLEYFTESFGPYPHEQIRVVEFPRYATSATAYPTTISYAEAFGFLTRVDEERHVDTPFMVLAHEVAHQWWGQQIVPANVQGAPLLTEVLAQYGAMSVTERTYGPEMVARFRRQMRIEYLNRRHTLENREKPLLLTDENRNVAYRKGSLVMYALREYLGEARLNAALRAFLERHGDGEPPHPTSLDLYREIRAVTPDTLRSLVTDFFERNVIWDLRVESARAEAAPDGQWRLTLDLFARKLETDSLGAEIEVPMDDPVEVGAYPRAPRAGVTGEALVLETHRLRSGRQTIRIVVPQRPEVAAVDPRYLLLGRQIDDNVRPVVGGGG